MKTPAQDSRTLWNGEAPAPAERMRLRRLSRAVPGDAAILEQVTARIGAFSKRFNGRGESLVDTVWQHFASKSPQMAVWAAFDESGALVGHALAFLQQWDGRWTIWVAQVEMDGTAGRHLRDQFLEAVDAWAHELNGQLKDQGITIEDALMGTPRMTDAWARHAGFEPYRMLYRRPLTGGL